MHGAVLRPDPIIKALFGAFCRGVSRRELVQAAASKIREAGALYACVSIYMLRGDKLELEAAAGRPVEMAPHAAGRAVKSGMTVMIRLHEHDLGTIAVESDVQDGFGEPEVQAVREVADALAVLL